jgi:hypothetical protein
MSAYAIRVAILLPHFPPQEPRTALQVAAPQQEAARLHTCPCQYARSRDDGVPTVPIAGSARNGSDSTAPMVAVMSRYGNGGECYVVVERHEMQSGMTLAPAPAPQRLPSAKTGPRGWAILSPITGIHHLNTAETTITGL